MASQIHVNDVGTRFKVTVKDDGTVVDISTATLLQLNFRKQRSVVFGSGIPNQVTKK
mgnify:CR=1 FL=1